MTPKTPFAASLALRSLLLAAALLGACSKTNPVEPTKQPAAPAGGGAYSITITAAPNVLPVGSPDPAVITVTVTRVADGGAAAGATAGLSTSLGSFSTAKSMTVTSLTLDAHGVGTAKLYAGQESGTATLLAQVETSVGQLNLPIRQSTIFIQSIQPTLGTPAGGDTVSIQGGGFVAPMRVTFGSAASPKVTLISSSLVQAVTPPSSQPVDSVMTVNVTVTSAIDKPNPPSDTLPQGFTYTTGGLLFLSSVSPNTGVAEGGDTVSIQGGGFVAPVRVTFGGVVAPQATVLSPTLLQVKTPRSPQAVPANTTLTVSVTVTAGIDQANPASDTLSEGFTYTSGTTPIQRPVVFSVAPPTGPNAGGQTVTIAGSFFPTTVANAQVLFGFQGASGQFDGLEAQVTAASAQQNSLTVRTPAASGLGQSLQNQTVDVLVRSRDTGFFGVGKGLFRYGDDLFILDVEPRTAPVQGGISATVSGRGFGSPVEVRLAGALATVVGQHLCPTDSSLQCIDVTVPPVSATNCSAPSGPVTVTNLGTGQSTTSSVTFTYSVVKPLLSGVTPGSGPAAGMTPVMLTGSLPFPSNENLRVLFGGVPATGVQPNPPAAVAATTPAFTGTFDQQTCTTPGGSPGTQLRSKAVDVELLDLDTGCSDTLKGSFLYQPADSTCTPDAIPPVASFDYETVAGQPLEIKFINRSTGGQPTTLTWDFGDGTSTVSPTLDPIFHLYAAAGTYVVKLTAQNAFGSSSASKTITVPLPVSP
ncbi:MAG TPA: IPT/TIG domain-containing protein [Thermoanaerobaculia bacterium]|jgi:PKD repeat protein